MLLMMAESLGPFCKGETLHVAFHLSCGNTMAGLIFTHLFTHSSPSLKGRCVLLSLRLGFMWGAWHFYGEG